MSYSLLPRPNAFRCWPVLPSDMPPTWTVGRARARKLAKGRCAHLSCEALRAAEFNRPYNGRRIHNLQVGWSLPADHHQFSRGAEPLPLKVACSSKHSCGRLRADCFQLLGQACSGTGIRAPHVDDTTFDAVRGGKLCRLWQLRESVNGRTHLREIAPANARRVGRVHQQSDKLLPAVARCDLAAVTGFRDSQRILDRPLMPLAGQ